MRESAKQPYHHGALREAFMEAAIEAIGRNGIDKLSLRALARSIGVSQTALYRHFASKNDLLAALAREGFRKLSALMRDAIKDHPDDPIAQIKTSGRAYIDFALANREVYPLMFTKTILEDCDDDNLHNEGINTFEILIGMVAHGIEKGVFPDYPPPTVAISLWAQTHGYVSLIFDSHLENHCEKEELDTIITIGTEALVRGFISFNDNDSSGEVKR